MFRLHKEIRIAPGTFDPRHPELSVFTQNYLFPSAKEDPFFGVLLEAKRSRNRGVRRLADFIVPYALPSGAGSIQPNEITS